MTRRKEIEVLDIFPLTPDMLERMLSERNAGEPSLPMTGRRQAARWPFPGTVELWVSEGEAFERHCLATSINLSTTGVGLRTDEPLAPGTELDIAIHEPEASLHGRAIVRHSTATPDGSYIVGMQFIFDDRG